MNEKNSYKFICGILIILALAGCSPSSLSLRYKPERQADSSEKPILETSQDIFADTEEPTDTLIPDYLDEAEFDEEPAESDKIDISAVINKYSNQKNQNELAVDSGSVEEKIIMEIIKYLDTPYKYGGNSEKGIDCSAFTQSVYKSILHLPLLRSAREQYTQGIEIKSLQDLQFGDLVFFNTRRRVRPGHVGIYIGSNLFAHASRKYGVTISSLDFGYYNRTFMGARRIDDLLQ